MDKSKKYAAFIIILSFIISAAYAIVRYNVYGGVLWSRLPFYVLNKAFALSGITLLIISQILPSTTKIKTFKQEILKHVGISGFLFILIHAAFSLLLFRPAVYPKFFDENNWLTTFAGLSMLTGVIALILLWIYNMSFSLLYKEKFSAHLKQNIFNAAIILNGFHLFFMGYSGWLEPEKWFGKLPPITLIAFCIFIIGMIFLIYKSVSNTKR